MDILGGGLAGCIAGVLNQKSVIYEAGPNKTSHQALLRFRSPDIGEAVGIPFKKVTVYKGIWHNDKPVKLSPRYINLYSRKVSDKCSYRSITKLETEERWVAPSNFHDLLKEEIGDRIEYDCTITSDILSYNLNRPVISTLPINVLAKLLGKEINIDKNISKIKVSKFIVPDCDVYMTYYYTDPTVMVYRASITGDVLIIESMWDITASDLKVVSRSFGLTGMHLEQVLFNFEQPNGKLSKIDEQERRKFIYEATVENKIYSLGRFATWRNLVLDDVYKDALKIKSLINKDNYEHFKEL